MKIYSTFRSSSKRSIIPTLFPSFSFFFPCVWCQYMVSASLTAWNIEEENVLIQRISAPSPGRRRPRKEKPETLQIKIRRLFVVQKTFFLFFNLKIRQSCQTPLLVTLSRCITVPKIYFKITFVWSIFIARKFYPDAREEELILQIQSWEVSDNSQKKWNYEIEWFSRFPGSGLIFGVDNRLHLN